MIPYFCHLLTRIVPAFVLPIIIMYCRLCRHGSIHQKLSSTTLCAKQSHMRAKFHYVNNTSAILSKTPAVDLTSFTTKRFIKSYCLMLFPLLQGFADSPPLVHSQYRAIPLHQTSPPPERQTWQQTNFCIRSGKGEAL